MLDVMENGIRDVLDGDGIVDGSKRCSENGAKKTMEGRKNRIREEMRNEIRTEVEVGCLRGTDATKEIASKLATPDPNWE